MGILDEAIREHLELKRQHGADDSELQQLEDQAFGQAERPGGPDDAALDLDGGPPTSSPDPAAEAPTEFMAQPDLGDETKDQPVEKEPAAAQPGRATSEPPPARREPAAGLADIQEAPEKVEKEPVAGEPEEVAEEPAAEEPSAAEHEAVPAPPVGSHTTEERHAIADQPTEMFDVEKEFASPDKAAPADEDLVAEEMTEARLGPAEPDSPLEVTAADDEDDDGFFDEQRLSDELDQALEAPLSDPEPVSDEHEVVEAASDEHEVEEPRTEIHRVEPAKKRDSDEDVLEETPDFLEEAPEDDQLWFEQKPPKDFDFDD